MNHNEVFKCPCCGASGPALADPRYLIEAPMTPREKVLLKAMIKRYPKATNTNMLINELYGGLVCGGPLQADHGVWTVITLLRKTLRKYGWTIPRLNGGNGNIGHYKLEELK